MMFKHVLAVILFSTLLLAAPAYQGKRTLTQADGTTFQAKAQGDEYLNWIETDQGDILRYNTQTKNYEYAEIKNGNLQKSGRIYKHDSQAVSKSASFTKKISRDDLKQLWLQKRQARHH